MYRDEALNEEESIRDAFKLKHGKRLKLKIYGRSFK